MNKGRSTEWNSASTLLLNLLSHESDSVKELAYKHLKARMMLLARDIFCCVFVIYFLLCICRTMY